MSVIFVPWLFRFIFFLLLIMLPTQGYAATNNDTLYEKIYAKHGSFLKTPRTPKSPMTYNVKKHTPLTVYTMHKRQLQTSFPFPNTSSYRGLVENNALHKNIWLRFKQTFPKSFEEQVVQVLLFTDGYNRQLASVQQMNYGQNRWQLSIDVLDAKHSKNTLYATFVHEAMHLYTLKPSQMKSIRPASCSTLKVAEGCLKKTADLYVFHQKFWSKTMQKDAKKMTAKRFYNKYNTHFVNNYAATSIEEDFAESFTHFVFSKKPKKPTTAKQKKIAYFYTKSRYVSLRKTILTNIHTHYN